MQRALDRLASTELDLLIVGGGVFGACAAWDASLRGLKVGLIEQNDFSSGASANCYKVAHGGLRYLQHGDVPRVIASSRDQTALLRIAPHLVKPQPIAVPTYGHSFKGREFLYSGLAAYHFLTTGKNHAIADRKRRIGLGESLNRRQVLESFPDLDENGLTGAVVFYDGQIYSPPRLVIAFLQSAAEQGAVIANHLEANTFLHHNGCVTGVLAEDRMSGDSFKIRAKHTLNATGGWSDGLLSRSLGEKTLSHTVFSRDACFVVERQFDHELGLAISAQSKDPDALLSREARHLFMLPWRDKTIVGVWHKVVADNPAEVILDNDELESFIHEFNSGYPALNLSLNSVKHTNYGLVPFGENQRDATNLSYGKRSLLVDHEKVHNIEGLTSLIGVRYTVARSDAARAVDQIAKRFPEAKAKPRTDRIPLIGAAFDTFDGLVSDVTNAVTKRIDSQTNSDLSATAINLAHNYGSEFSKVLDLDERLEHIGDSSTLTCEITHAVENEMAVRLADLVFRRTDLGSGGITAQSLRHAAEVMGQKLSWTPAETAREVDNCLSITGLPSRQSIFKVSV